MRVQRPTKTQAELGVLVATAAFGVGYGVWRRGMRETARSVGVSLALQIVVAAGRVAARKYGR